MKKLILITLMALFIAGCSDTDTSRSGLDLEAVLALAKTSANPQEFETKLNEENGINNLDLNEDGNTDYISVDEYDAQGQRNLSLYVSYDNDNKQQVAELLCGAENTEMVCQIVGNDKVYGSTQTYETRDSVRSDQTNQMLMYYLIYRTAFAPYHTTHYYYNTPTVYKVRDYTTYKSVVSTPTYKNDSIKRSKLTTSSSSKLVSSPVAGRTTPKAVRASVPSRSTSYGSSSGTSYGGSSRSTTPSRSTSSGRSSGSYSSSSRSGRR